ncbi:ciliogenesis-associated TTC17-interacting protein isoform X2 [Erythrolamprus reginae]|uniref:ciliogenesis-associated TTC17-interacting protein isoform X2 n=1 Tax=Erythrolamprus reginae TaxID=121349 RepID=UPI00396CA36C
MQKKPSEVTREPEVTEKIPAASKEAVSFLSLIEIKEIQPCLFEESLVAISETGETIGTFSVSVKWAYYSLDGWLEEDCFLVCANSKGTIDGVSCKISLTGYVSKKLEILEQRIQESVRFRDHPVETRTKVMQRHGQLYVTKVIVEKDNSLGFQKQKVKKEEVDVFVIERTVHSIEAPPLNWQFYFLPDGHLSRRVQVGSPAIMLILQMPILIDTDEPDPRPVFEKVLLDWEEDAELYSKFLDRKEELQASHATYVRRHPELNTLLADFLQLLLLRKPDDVVTFAAEFFSPFSSQQAPCRSFRSSDKPSPFRSHV